MQESGTHSILDMSRVLTDGDEPDFGTFQRVTEAEALARAGAARPTRAHVEALKPLAEQRWFGRYAVLHDEAGIPNEISF
ncbi:hypothetical protein ACWIF8_15390 [Micromonospora chalcea]